MDQLLSEDNPLKRYWNWMNSGVLYPLKILWTGLSVTSVVMMNGTYILTVIGGGFIAREIFLMAYDPTYQGHKVWDWIEPDEE